MRAAFVIIGCALLFSSCTTPRKIYKPPSSAKVDASTRKVKEGVDEAHKTARTAKKHVEDAQKSADKIIVLSMTARQKLDAIIKAAPPELQQPLASVRMDVEVMEVEEQNLRVFLSGAYKEQHVLDSRLTNLAVHVIQLESNQKGYYAEALGLANDATTEREARRAAEGQLIKQRILGWLWKIGGGAVVILIIVLIVLWVTGKLAFKFAK